MVGPVDWTTVLTAAIAGLSGVGAGYIGMRQQVRTTRIQLENERREREEKRDDALIDKRVTTYGALLDVERRLRWLLAAGTRSDEEYAEWWLAYNQAHNLTALIGSREVRGCAEALADLYGRVDSDRGASKIKEPHRALEHAFKRHEPELVVARRNLLDVMRSDTEAGDDLGERSAAPAATVRAPQVLALASTSARVSPGDLRRAAAALQVQIDRDFGPAWGIAAQVEVVAGESGVPEAAWPVVIADDIDAPGMSSYHSYRADGVPFVMVVARDGWEESLSHDCLEMLASPFNRETVEAPSPVPGQGRVHILVQPCDACAGPDHTYEIDGVRVSDFCLPRYFQPLEPTGSGFDHAGRILKPFDLLPGGYVTWYDPASGSLWRRRSGDEPEVQKLAAYPGLYAALRATAGVGFGDGV
jgi:hypothetical protein